MTHVTSSLIEKELARNARQARSLRPAQTPRLAAPPTPLEFARQVNANLPCVIAGVGDSWPALTKWRSREYLESAMQGREATVSVTPNGLADAVVEDRFVLPFEQKMPFTELLDELSWQHSHPPPAWKSGQATGAPPVYYVQSQNDNLGSSGDCEFEPLLADVPRDISFATAALGKAPEAVNVWFGSGNASTAVHKDHYENLYLVIAGVKTFVLIPPTELFCLYEKPYTTAHYVPSSTPLSGDTVWSLADDVPPSTTPWASVDPIQPDVAAFPLFRHCKPVIVTVRAGEMLYLPSMWGHQVLQQEEELDGGFRAAIAVNYWYDMEYGDAFCAVGLGVRLGRTVAGIEEWEAEDSESEPDID
ncbi:cupin-like domain-containing protein [Geranomyces variabilis]|nr:cupin-like domain-containing protein [Geranomyces variabilis]KAJ3143325.1 JmjC domain-containing protein 7 [Geranomyces variabilis]